MATEPEWKPVQRAEEPELATATIDAPSITPVSNSQTDISGPSIPTARPAPAPPTQPLLEIIPPLPAAPAEPSTIPPASGPTSDLERRVRELENRLSTIDSSNAEAEMAPGTAANPTDTSAPAAGGSGRNLPYTSGWDRNNGFFIRSPDGLNRLRLTGQIQADYRGFTDPNDRLDIDAFTVRRARIGVEANVFQYHEFRFLTEFGAGSLSGNTSITTTTRLVDAYYNMHYWDEFQVETGKFKQPFSYEQLIQDRFTPFMERSLIDQLVPQRDVGVMLHGQKLLGDRFDYGMAIANGEQNGDTDTNDNKDFAFRVAVRPLRGFVPLLDNLQLGMAYTTGIEQEPETNFVLRTPAGIPFFNFLPNVRANGLRNRWSPEFVYFRGGFGFVAQWFHMEQHFNTPNGRTNLLVPFDGYFAMASYLLTGETRTSYTVLEPLRPFNPRGGDFGPGAWEIAARVSRLHVSEDVFYVPGAALANPNGLSNAATEMTLGFNWFLNGFVRVQFNWERSWFDRPVQLGPGRGTFYTSDNALMTRLQIQF